MKDFFENAFVVSPVDGVTFCVVLSSLCVDSFNGKDVVGSIFGVVSPSEHLHSLDFPFR